MARRTPRVGIELHHVGGDRLEERPIVGDDQHRRRGGGEELAQLVEPVAVQGVGGLVEQVAVRPAGEERGQADADPLPAGERRHRAIKHRGSEPQLAERAVDPRLQLVAAERGVGVEGAGVGVRCCRWVATCERALGRPQPALGVEDSRAGPDVLARRGRP